MKLKYILLLLMASTAFGVYVQPPYGFNIGGTSATTQQGALNAIAGAVTNHDVIRCDGANCSVAAIQAADVPTLNQNTTGSAASFTGSLTGDVSGTQSATSVNKINGTSLSGLSTGILKNTTGTGVPSTALSSDVISLFSGCSGTQYLGADGNCHTPASGLTFSDSLVNTAGNVTLVNDSASPTASQYYGTNAGSVLGYYNIPSGFTNPMTTLGDIIFENATPVAARLAGSTSATQAVLTQTGTGVVSASPAWTSITTLFQSLYETVATTAGDLIYGGASGTPTRLAVGTAGQQLAVNAGATAPAWNSNPAVPTVPLGTCTTSQAVDWSTGSKFTVTLTNSDTCAFTFSNTTGRTITIDFYQPASGGGTGVASWSSVLWPATTTPTITTGNSATDTCTFTNNGTDTRGSCLQAF